jgi:ubiquinone/menaquinone biosynthesis C-methylase UbiE
MHVLEHVKDPSRLLAEMARVTRPRGLLLCAVPNGHSFSDRLFKLYYSLFHSRRDEDYDGHVQSFDRTSFLEMVQNVGVEILACRDIEESYSWLHKHRLVQTILRGATRAMRRGGAGARFAYGWHIVARRR